VFYYSAHRAHWNVEGDDFVQYHDLFSNIYEDANGAIDALAENIRKVQAMPTSLTSSIMNASFKDDSTSKDAMVLAADLLSKNDMLNQAILSAFTTANASNEQGIANFLAERDDMHKKWAWQLRASLNMENDMEAKESWNITTNGSEAIAEATEEPTEEVVDSVNPEVAPEAGEQEEPKAELTEEPKAAEQDVNDDKLQVLQEENAKLREALHRTLVERVVDTKISLGVEAVEEREQLINDHVTRSAGSLADSLRDLAKMPVAKKSAQKLNETAIVENDIVFEKEDNVVVEDEEVTTAPKAKVNTVEELFVDAFMGRRKL